MAEINIKWDDKTDKYIVEDNLAKAIKSFLEHGCKAPNENIIVVDNKKTGN